MESTTLAWAAILIPLGLGFIGWLVNNLITKKIDDLQRKQEESEKDREDIRALIDNKERSTYTNIFKRVDEIKAATDVNFVRKDIYQQSQDFQDKQTDDKFKSFLFTMTSQFQNLEDKIDDLKLTLRNLKG